MRLLVTIPHYFRRSGPPGFYGSESGDAEARIRQVTQCLAALHQTFGHRQTLAATQHTQANTTLAGTVDVVLVTNAADHLADQLPRHLFVQYAAELDPRHLGFLCHQILREHAGRYDCYAYLEDDIEVTDPLFLHKLAWFSGTFGPNVLLQPNRFELAHDLDVMKFYIDGNTTQPEIPARYQDTSVNPRLTAKAFGQGFVFERVDNVHAGCFFLGPAQLARILALPGFGVPTDKFFGPLESAATLPLMQAFEVYKPARENAGFLEAQHLGRRFLYAKAPDSGPEPDLGPDPGPGPAA